MSNFICYYHKIDLDGKCSAAIVRRKFSDCELIGVDYPDRPDFDRIKPGDTVVVVDFSFEPEEMVTLLNITQDNVVWVDHHRSAIIKIMEYDKKTGSNLTADIGGLRLNNQAGCELTWEYFFPDEPMPEAVRLLGRYDVWDHRDPDVLSFQYGMRQMEWAPDSTLWDPVFRPGENALVARLIKEGHLLLKYEEQQNATYAKAMAFPVKFEGCDAWSINKALSNSKIFETLLDAHERPLWILFSYKAGVWRYSLYSAPESGLDVSKIAAKYDGGGHAGAAGFQSDKYLLKEIDYHLCM
jgi:oligoribonuclease NrnB/cAMP/cGMP phosphodiesterase (DHH superfamily)